jgi:hypothetical protein
MAGKMHGRKMHGREKSGREKSGRKRNAKELKGKVGKGTDGNLEVWNGRQGKAMPQQKSGVNSRNFRKYA